MNQEYLFKELRKGVTAARQIVVTGYCTAEFVEDKDITAIIVRNGAETILPSEYTVMQAPAFQQHQSNGKTFSRVLTACVTIPLKLKEKDVFYLRAETKQGTTSVSWIW